MSHIDPEVEALKAAVDCAALLEGAASPWQLDRAESTPNSRKYRRGPGEIVIVNHQGRGWWDPQSERRGDAFALVQHLDPKLNFGEARVVLRRFIGVQPSEPEFPRRARRDDRSIAELWRQRSRIRPSSTAWRYLDQVRALPHAVIRAAADADVVRQGYCGSAWFAHRDQAGAVCHIECRGPSFKGSVKGGTKTLFLFQRNPLPKARFALAEAPIDALSVAAIEGIRSDTLYGATGGGMGPETIAAIMRALAGPGAPAVLVSATDANRAGDRYAEQHLSLAEGSGVGFERLRPPPPDEDWNEVLKRCRTARKEH